MDVLLLLVFAGVILYVFGGMVVREDVLGRRRDRLKAREEERKRRALEDLISPPRI